MLETKMRPKLKRVISYGAFVVSILTVSCLVIMYKLSELTEREDYGEYGGEDGRSRGTGRKTTTRKGQEEVTVLPPLELKRLLREAENDNNKRLSIIEKVCEKYNLGLFRKSVDKTSAIVHPPVPQYGVFYFDIPNKWSLCPIYKAGSSTWLYNLCILGGMSPSDLELSKKQLSDLARSIYPELEPERAEQHLQTTTKVVTVRHPFERLLSAYRDKLENFNHGQEHGTVHFYKKYGSKIVKKYRPGGNNTLTWQILKPMQYLWNPNHERPAGVEPTFREFVLYLVNLNLANYADDHWIPYYLYCTPCLLNYDIVAKVETLDRDQLYVIGVTGLANKIQPKWRHKTQFLNTSGTESESVSAVAKIYFSQLTTNEIELLYKKYQLDFELFDYSPNDYYKYASDYKN